MLYITHIVIPLTTTLMNTEPENLYKYSNLDIHIKQYCTEIPNCNRLR